MFGADPVDEKWIRLEGKDIEFRTPAQSINSGFVYTTEDRKYDGAVLGLDVESNITLASLKKIF